mmetsp:Transcript_15372/g.18475  ORF Transcript_15372/g.18475 Transcript_15372/m.18475 type:complete len:253 (+) Transcript_15372:103-861(+)|eukprot:CAMPEP_0195284662 /NCGR_PEP_ID=MMETSP0707-20130614/2787_1 /TAXON_ID=33640 /ORGANISM="Asterionellopsis glacialis, Strain CCMP134" /LENGTH=252 /DNA_ID=CAMNT_0040344041 /DNA_START=383 /DNA_END=1141 /DNA_ORIENTATION=-
MPRGTNYANSEKDQQTVAADPIKKNPKKVAANKTDGGQSNEPCMPYLAGSCALPAGACKKRHPPKVEADKLVAKYKTVDCRFADKCRTKACLYNHSPEKPAGDHITENPLDFPPLSGEESAPTTKSLPPPMGAWGKTPPTSTSTNGEGTSTPTSTGPSSPSKENVKGGPKNSNSPKSSTATATTTATAWNGKNTNIVTPDYAKALTKNNNGDAAAASSAITKKTVTATAAAEGILNASLNASAKEFVPKNFS